MLNEVRLIGNLGGDPELRTTSAGKAVCTLRIATSHKYKAQDGSWQTETEWHTVVCWGNTALNAGKYLRKGRQVSVSGRLCTRKWQDKEGRDRWTTEVVCNKLIFLGSGQRQEQQGGGGYAPPPEGDSQEGSEDIPF